MYIPARGKNFDSLDFGPIPFYFFPGFHLVISPECASGWPCFLSLFCVEKFNLLVLMDYHFPFLLVRFSDRISPFSARSS